MPVSIKMAKTQNLSLNPTKISGTCGRLMCCLKYEQNAYEDAAKRMPRAESFVQTPDGPGNVKSVDLLRETMKVALDSAGPNEPLKTYHSCEVRVLRNGKGSREGIEIPERPARYVEERTEEPFESPIFATPFYMDHPLEDAPVREKFGQEGGENRSRRRHRGGRRKPSAAGQARPAEERQTDNKKPGGKSRPPKPQQARAEAAGEGGGEAKHRKPYYRGGRRRGKGGGGGTPPKAE